MRKLIILFFALFLISGCSTFFNQSSKEYSALNLRLNNLETRVGINEANIANNTSRINSIEKRLFLIRKRLEKEREDGFINKIPPISAIIGKDAKKTQSDDDNKTSQQETITKKNLNTIGVKTAQLDDNSSKMNLKEKTTDDIKVKTDIYDYKVYYKKALKAYMSGDYTLSAAMFENFEKTFKNNNLDDNALFWLAHSYLHLNNVQKAAAIFNKLIEKYPYGSIGKGGKTDAALYDLIKIYKDDKNVSNYYKKILIQRFPNSQYAKRIKK